MTLLCVITGNKYLYMRHKYMPVITTLFIDFIKWYKPFTRLINLYDSFAPGITVFRNNYLFVDA